MWVKSSMGCPQFLGHAGVVHDPLVSINFSLGSSLAAILTAHLICHEGYFWWMFLAHPSLPNNVIFHGFFLFCAIGGEGVF